MRRYNNPYKSCSSISLLIAASISRHLSLCFPSRSPTSYKKSPYLFWWYGDINPLPMPKPATLILKKNFFRYYGIKETNYLLSNFSAWLVLLMDPPHDWGDKPASIGLSKNIDRIWQVGGEEGEPLLQEFIQVVSHFFLASGKNITERKSWKII